MHKVSNNVAPLLFNDMFKKPSHQYPTKFSHNNFSLKKCSLNNTKYCISLGGPKLWNEFLNTNEKQINSYNLFSRKVKLKLLDTYFKLICIFEYTQMQAFGGALVECVLLGVLRVCAVDLWRERPCWSVTSIKLHGGFVDVTLQHGCSPVDLLRIFQSAFS